MAETKNQEKPPLPAKRKPDLSREDNEDNQKKTQKLEASPENYNNVSSVSQEKNHSLEASERNSSPAEVKDSRLEADFVAEDEDDEDDEGEDYEGEDEDEDGDYDSGQAEENRKGEGKARDDKGKGKMIVEEQDDSDDEDEDGNVGSNLSNGESDLSEDPLAEVDLDNILPSRTRRRTVQPGVYISNDLGHDDDSDDSDA